MPTKKPDTKLEEVNFITKLSCSKKTGLDIDTVREACKKSSKAVMRIFGLVMKTEYGSSDNGPWTKFKGNFAGINLLTGEEFRSGSMFLPSAVESQLDSIVVNAAKSEGFSGLEIAFDISAKKSEVPIGYEYNIKNLMPDQESDPLLAMRDRLPSLPPVKK